jgi:NADH-quinone oxidoreductase subunit C
MSDDNTIKDGAAKGGEPTAPTAPPGPEPTPEPTPVVEKTSDAHATDLDLTKAQATGNTDPVRIGERRGMFGAKRGTDTSGYGGLRTPILFPGGSEKPYGSYYDELTGTLETALDGAGDSSFGEAIERVVVDRGELTLHVEPDAVADLCTHLRDSEDHRYELLLGVSGVDFPEQPERFHVVYHLLSITHNRRVRLEVSVPDADARIPSVVDTWPAADWHERETYDMFGIVFEGHPSLTRILMPDDWPGHPQRKDYPLGGIPVEYKGGTVPPPDERRSYS